MPKKQMEMEKLLEQERKKGLDMVEKEKEKMRKLIKALAEREKRGKVVDAERFVKFEEWRTLRKLRERERNEATNNNRKKVFATGGSGGRSRSEKRQAKRAVVGAQSLKKK